MSKLARAIAVRDARRRALDLHGARIERARAELVRNYRACPTLVLGVSALTGFAFGRYLPRLRPPNELMRFASQWGFLFLRGLI